MVLGLNVTMDMVMQLSSCGLVGKFMFHNRVSKEAMKWLESTLTSFLGYSPIINFLMKGWLCITCRSEVDTLAVLQRPQLQGTCSLVLKRWHPYFNPKFEPFKILHVWALLPGLPLQFWNKKCIEQTENSIRRFIYLDKSILSQKDKRTAKVLVEVDSSADLIPKQR